MVDDNAVPGPLTVTSKAGGRMRKCRGQLGVLADSPVADQEHTSKQGPSK